MFRNNRMARVVGLVAGYIACLLVVKFVFTTLITYAMLRSMDHSEGSLRRMGDLIQANQVIIYGGSALIFVGLLHFLHPLTTTRAREIFDIDQLRRSFAANAFSGVVLMLVLVVATSLGGYMSYLGIYIRFDEVVGSIISALVFGGCLFVLVMVEEYILRHVLECSLSDWLGGHSAIVVCGVSSIVFLMIKALQFELNIMSVINLVLLNLTLSMIARQQQSYLASTSFAAAFLVPMHALFGLPFMEQDMPGLLLLRGASDTRLGRLLSGGADGPESSLVLTLLLALYLYLPQIRAQKLKT